MILGSLVLSGCSGAPQRPPVAALPTASAPPAAAAQTPRQSGFGADYTPMLAAGHAPNIWPRLRAGFGLPAVDDRQLRAELAWYTQHPLYLNTIWGRAEKYLYYILTEVERRGLPTELALLPVVESGFRPTAVSSSAAAGLWQFVPDTAAIRGLTRDRWVDERVDIVTSTNAALDYLEELNRLFGGDWLLALAAYNGGPGYISRMRSARRAAGRGTEFRDLPVREETRAYVWRMLALRQLVLNPDVAGIALPNIANAPYFDTVEVHSPLELGQLASREDLTREELDALNPGLRRGVTPPGRPHHILVPMDIAPSIRRQLADDAQGGVQAAAGAATAKPVTLASLSPIGVVQAAPQTPGTALAAEVCPGVYAVRRGDTLTRIARTRGLTAPAIRACNRGLRADRLQVGQRLKLPAGARQTAPRDTLRSVTYRVRPGDTYTRISAAYGTSLSTFLDWNRHLAAHGTLRPGEHLQLYLAR